MAHNAWLIMRVRSSPVRRQPICCSTARGSATCMHASGTAILPCTQSYRSCRSYQACRSCLQTYQFAYTVVSHGHPEVTRSYRKITGKCPKLLELPPGRSACLCSRLSSAHPNQPRWGRKLPEVARSLRKTGSSSRRSGCPTTRWCIAHSFAAGRASSVLWMRTTQRSDGSRRKSPEVTPE